MSISQKPSTRARKIGYAKLNKLRDILFKLIYTRDHIQETYAWGEHPFLMLFRSNDSSWRDYLIRHTPKDKIGGPKRGVR